MLGPTLNALLLELSFGDQSLGPYLYQIYLLSRVSQEMNAIIPEIVRYLIRNKLVGKNFLAYLTHEHGGSVLKMVGALRQRVKKDLEKKEIFADKPIH